MTDTAPSQTPERRSRENQDDPRERPALEPILIDFEASVRMRGDVCEKLSVIETRVGPNVGMC